MKAWASPRSPLAPCAALATPCPNTQRVLGVYVCPSDGGSELNYYKGQFAKSNYRGIMGSITQPTGYYQVPNNGIIYLNSCITASDITDGTSYTMIVGECSLNFQNPMRYGAIWAGMRGTDSEGTIWISDGAWWINSSPQYCIDGQEPQAFGSRHPGGALFLFADGSVHFLNKNIDGPTLEHLAARNDGQPVSGF